MFAPYPQSVAVRLLVIVAAALAFAFVLATSAAQSARADDSQWMRSQPHWWDGSNGWHQSWHHRRHFHEQRPRVIIGGSGFAFSSPGLVIINPGFASPGFASPGFGNPGFIVRPQRFVNSGFVVRQPSFIVRQPSFIVRQPNFIVGQPGFIGQPVFVGRPRKVFGHHHHHGWNGSWSHRRWPGSHGSGMHIIMAP